MSPRLLWLLPLAASLAGCQSAGGLPTHHLTGQGPTAVIEGALVQHGTCLFVQSVSGQELLVIWPRGYGIDGDSVVEGTYVRAKVGQSVRLGGGGYHDAQYDFLRSLMDQDIDATCRSEDYWLATGVL